MRLVMRPRMVLGYLALAALGACALLVLVVLTRTPSLTRDWKTEYAVLPEVAFEDERVSLRKVRNFSYHPDGAIEKADYYDADY